MSFNITLEKNVPAPDPRSKNGWYDELRKWPWMTMELGDSFVVPDARTALSAHNSFLCHKKSKLSRMKHSYTLTRRKQQDGTYRVWLIDKT